MVQSWFRAILVSIPLAVLVAGCTFEETLDGPALPPEVNLAIPSGAYQASLRDEAVNGMPERLDLVVGQSVVIRNDDQAIHYFADVMIWPGQSVRKTFTDEGEFRYRGGLSCSVNADRGMVIVVRSGGDHGDRFDD